MRRARQLRPRARLLLLATMLLVVSATGSAGAQGTTATATATSELMAFTVNGSVSVSAVDGGGRRLVATGTPRTFRQQPTPPWVEYPWYRWLPDGKTLLVYRVEHMTADPAKNQQTVLSVDADGSQPRELAVGVAQAPSLSSDGRWLAYLRAPTPTATPPPSVYDLVVLDIATGTERILAHDASLSPPPTWAIDGDEIIYGGASQPTGDGGGVMVSLYRSALNGAPLPVPGYARYPCEGPGQFSADPAAALLNHELAEDRFGAGPPLQWSVGQEMAIYNSTCVAPQLVDLRNQTATDLNLFQVRLSATGNVTGINRDGAIVIAGAQGDMVNSAVAQGMRPLWSPDGAALYFIQRSVTDEHQATHADAGYTITLQERALSLWQTDADGSNARLLAERDIYGLGLLQFSVDGRSLIYPEVGNSTLLWERRLPGDGISEDLMQRFGPLTRIVRLDLETGEVTTLVRNAGRPVVASAVGVGESG